MNDKGGAYRDADCPSCKRRRVLANGVCDKCRWNVDRGEYEKPPPPDTDPNWMAAPSCPRCERLEALLREAVPFVVSIEEAGIAPVDEAAAAWLNAARELLGE